jgi:hypothetical protein
VDSQDSLELMAMLDNGRTLLGHELTADARARLFALVDNVTQETWANARGIILREPMTTLWQALLRHTDYDVYTGPRHAAGESPAWPKLPTSAQVLEAIRATLAR